MRNAHKFLCLFGATANTYYPIPGAAQATFHGASTTSGDSIFDSTEDTATIRAFLVSNCAAATVVNISLRDMDNNVIMEWNSGDDFAMPLLCGPDGFKIEGGFKIVTDGAAYFTLIYDK